MNEQVLLMDLKNIQRFDFGKASPKARIDGNGRNALDFHIACHLGEGICKFPRAELVILSNDKGFDPLVRHLGANGFKCRRDGQALSAPAPKPQLPAHAQAVADLLRRSEKNKRPRKRATLTNYLAAHFHKKLTGEEIKQAVKHLRETGLIAGTEAAVTYNF